MRFLLPVAVGLLAVVVSAQAQSHEGQSPFGMDGAYGGNDSRAWDPFADAQRVLKEPDNRRFGELQQALTTIFISIDQEPTLAETDGLMDAVAPHFHSPDEQVARQAANLLCRGGLKWLPLAMERLKSPRQNERIAAITLLSGLAYKNPDHSEEFSPAIGILRSIMLEKRRAEQSLAISALYTLGENALPVLVEGLSLPTNQGGQQVGNQLKACGAATVPALRAALAGKDRNARRNAAIALSWFAHGEAAPAVPELIVALNDPDDDTRRLVLRALCASGKEFRAAVPTILERVEAGDPGYLRALAFSKIDVEHLDRVLNCLASTSESVDYASSILASAGPDAVPRLTAALSEFPPDLQVHLIHALGEIGPPARSSAPELWKFAENGNSAAMLALAKITPEDAKLAKLLIDRLKNGSWRSDITGSHFMSDLIAPAHNLSAHHLPLFLDGLRHENGSIRQGCFLALAGLPADRFPEITPKLKEFMLKSPHEVLDQIADLPRGSGMTADEYFAFLEELAADAPPTVVMRLRHESNRASEMKEEELTKFLQPAPPFAYPLPLPGGPYGYSP